MASLAPLEPERKVVHTPKPSRPEPTPRPFDDSEFEEKFNPFASPKAEDTRPSFTGAYEPSRDEFEPVYASFWARFGSALLDGFATNILAICAALPVGFAIGLQGGAPQFAGLVGQLLGVVVGWLYFALMESSSYQATLGKMALGIKVTDLNGHPIRLGRATGRHFGKFISGILLGLGYFMQPFDNRRQALHDKMAGCLVVKGR